MHRFGPFEVDFSKAELRKNGVSIRLQEQPLRILQELLKRPGEVLTREELRDALWPSDTFVDFERSLNAAVGKLRAALNDSSEQPLYVETVARKGYRFIAPVSQNGTQSAPAPHAAAPQNLKRWLAVAAGGLCLAWLAWTLRPTAPPAVGSVHFTVNLPEGTELAGPSFAPQMAISPDGRTLALAVSTAAQMGLFTALAGGGRNARTAPYLWLRPLASESGQRLEGTEGASRPFWSPNGREIGFFTPGKLKKIAASGGPVQILCDAKEPFGASWGPDGTIVFSAGGPLLRVSAVGGVPTQLTQLDATRGDFRHAFPQFLPGGRRFLLFIAPFDPAKVGVFLGSLDGGQPQRVFANRHVAVFAPPDHLLFVRHGVLLTQRWDGQHVQERQAPIALATGVRAFTIGQSAFSVSQNGVLVYRQAGSGLVTKRRAMAATVSGSGALVRRVPTIKSRSRPMKKPPR